MAVDWADTRQLDYHNTVMQDSMIAAMQYWLVKTVSMDSGVMWPGMCRPFLGQMYWPVKEN
jgi:hypothetical protein